MGLQVVPIITCPSQTRVGDKYEVRFNLELRGNWQYSEKEFALTILPNILGSGMSVDVVNGDMVLRSEGKNTEAEFILSTYAPSDRSILEFIVVNKYGMPLTQFQKAITIVA